MRTSRPVQITRDDEARNGAQPMEARKAWELRCCPKLPRPKNFAFITASDWRVIFYITTFSIYRYVS